MTNDKAMEVIHSQQQELDRLKGELEQERRMFSSISGLLEKSEKAAREATAILRSRHRWKVVLAEAIKNRRRIHRRMSGDHAREVAILNRRLEELKVKADQRLRVLETIQAEGARLIHEYEGARFFTERHAVKRLTKFMHEVQKKARPVVYGHVVAMDCHQDLQHMETLDGRFHTLVGPKSAELRVVTRDVEFIQGTVALVSLDGGEP